MKEFDAEIQIAVQADARSVLDVLSINHNCSRYAIDLCKYYFFQSFVGAKVVILRKKTKTFLQKCIYSCVI